MKSLTLLRDSVFNENPYGHGGHHRTMQMAELVRRAGFEIADIPSNGIIKKRISIWRMAALLANNHFPLPANWHIFQKLRVKCFEYDQALNSHEGAPLLLWEATREDHFLVPYLAKKRGYKVLALPHNLESLSGDEVTKFPFLGRNPYVALQREAHHLRQADAIFTICEKERWLLELLGLKPLLLPYYPPQPILSFLTRVRQERRTSVKKGFLTLGSAVNPPTRRAMKKVLALLREINPRITTSLEVAGFGTEVLRSEENNVGVQILGSLDDQELFAALSHAQAVIIPAVPTTGALCRLTEMQVAGVPIITNKELTVNLKNRGIYFYENPEELITLLQRSELETPDLPQRPVDKEEKFIHILKTLWDTVS